MPKDASGRALFGLKKMDPHAPKEVRCVQAPGASRLDGTSSSLVMSKSDGRSLRALKNESESIVFGWAFPDSIGSHRRRQLCRSSLPCLITLVMLSLRT